MFRGSIPGDMRSVISEVVEDWTCSDVYVGCSGNYTVERVLDESKRFNIHSNDVTFYSAVLGWFFSGMDFQLAVSPEFEEEYGWLDEYLQTSVDATATVLLGSRLAEGLGKSNPYYKRILRAYRDQWSDLHSKTVERLQGTTMSLASFAEGDVVEWASSVPEEQGMICFPPFFAGDYEQMFEKLAKLFIWEPQEYAELDQDRRGILLGRVRSKRHWIYGTHEAQEELEPYLSGVVQTTNRGVPIYVYSDADTKRVVRPAQVLEPVMNEKLMPGMEIGNRMGLALLTGGQFNWLRSQYMNAHIKPGSPSQAVGVLVDGVLIGTFAISVAPTQAQWDTYLLGPHVYLLSDFPVNHSDYPRLSKLVLYAALSRESKLLMERCGRKRFRGLVTTAYTNGPVSMKYRGLFRLLKRKDSQDGRHKNQLEYGAELGTWTLNEGLELWKAKHGERRA